MGYNLTIGDAYLEFSEEEGYLTVSARSEKHGSAPAFGEPTDHTNERWPSYCSWCDTLRDMGVYELFYEPNRGRGDSMIGGHPGYRVITQDLLDQTRNLSREPMKTADTWPRNRITWLLYWMEWALENCKIPILTNT